jgi:quercetin dioxygenase-like cupin family protein
MESSKHEERTRRGARFEMPDGSVYVITTGAVETRGERTEMEFTLPPGNVSPPPHVHPRQFDEFEVLEGTLEVMQDGHWHAYGPGEAVSVPPGTLHTFRNRSDAPVRATGVHRPAMRFEQYIEHISRLMRARGITSGKDPRVAIYLSMLTLEYADTVVSARMRERALLRSLAGLGRLLGMNTRVEDASAAT